MRSPSGFTFRLEGSEIVVVHDGQRAATMRGRRTAEFEDAIKTGADPQELMARLTGNDKRGRERTAKRHPRNAGRDRRQGVCDDGPGSGPGV